MDNRIDHFRKRAGMTVQQLADRAKISRGYLNELKKGQKRLNADVMKRLASALEVKMGDLIDGDVSPTVPVAAYVGLGGEVFPYNDTKESPHETEVECPPGLDPRYVVAIRIQTDSMLPVLQPEWIVYYSERRDIEIPIIREGWQVPYNKPTDEPLSEFFGKLCIIRLSDGRTMLRTLKKGHAPGRYNLTISSAADIENAEIQWAAKIIFIKTT
jgi:transcriptional regulator with XRE-family HTH domain